MKKEILINGDPIPFGFHIILWDENTDKESIIGFKGPDYAGLYTAEHTKVSVWVNFMDSQDEIIGKLWAITNPKGGTRLSINIKDEYLEQWEEAWEEFEQELKKIGYLPFTDLKGFGDFSSPIYQDIIVAYNELVQKGLNATDEQIAECIPVNPSTNARYTREWVNKCRKKLRKVGFNV